MLYIGTKIYFKIKKLKKGFIFLQLFSCYNMILVVKQDFLGSYIPIYTNKRTFIGVNRYITADSNYNLSYEGIFIFLMFNSLLLEIICIFILKTKRGD